MFRLLRAYRYFYRQVSGGADWDAPVPYIHPKVLDELSRISNELIKNQWWRIDPPRHADYNNDSYDIVAYTDASREGWGAVVHFQFTGEVTTLQQRFVTHHQRPFYKGQP
ncbi:TATE DNA transposon protein, partial [Trypanosoma theileri]